MTNTMNQVKAVALNTAIVDELKAVLGIMTRYNETEDKTEAIETGYGDVFEFGVCEIIETFDHTPKQSEPSLFMDNAVLGFLPYWMDNFATPAESKLYTFPVTINEKDALELYHSTKDKWLGEYGKRRLFFFQSLIVFLSERTHKWHMDCDGDYVPFYTAEELYNQ